MAPLSSDHTSSTTVQNLPAPNLAIFSQISSMNAGTHSCPLNTSLHMRLAQMQRVRQLCETSNNQKSAPMITKMRVNLQALSQCKKMMVFTPKRFLIHQ